ncbi:hypothetical protein C8R43DRAFT_1212083 [Mycena crocata]|nr:hypothetical protein C8R43DRAFT_1212083 [Mycena crocata]
MAAPQDPNLKNDRKAPESLCASPAYHPTFSSPDADIVLESFERTLYRVHSYTLRTTSVFFRTMLSLPPPEGGHSIEPIAIHQPDASVEPLLCLMSGLATLPWRSFDELESVLFLAENWDTPGPIASLRTALTAHKWLTAFPLRLYALAVHFGWRTEAALASTHTLSLNLFDPEHAAALQSLPSTALLALLRLHRGRRITLNAMLNSPERFIAGNGEPFHCSACAITPLENRTWRALKARVGREMDVRPLGDGLGLPVGGMSEWEESRACWAARCTKDGCGAVNYDRIATLKQLRACVDSLPIAVDLGFDQDSAAVLSL